MEVDAYNPQGQKYSMQATDTNNNKLLDFNGSLSNVKTTIDIQGCIENVDKLGMKFMDSPTKWVTLSEVKLFTNASTTIPPVEPDKCPEGWHYDPALRKCIEDVIVEPPITSSSSRTTNHS